MQWVRPRNDTRSQKIIREGCLLGSECYSAAVRKVRESSIGTGLHPVRGRALILADDY
jgi:hypothetical protein